jgi:plastocyanin
MRFSQHSQRQVRWPAVAVTVAAVATFASISEHALMVRVKADTMSTAPTARVTRETAGSSAGRQTQPALKATTVAMDGTTFDPGEVTVAVGDTVTWVNKDPFPHNVTSKAGGFRSGDLAPDATWRFRARTRGSFPFECTLHPGMMGTLHVK